MAKAGQPTKYKDVFENQVLILAEKGFTDVDIAQVFNVTKATINNWKKKFPQFFASIKKGKAIADQKVVQSLYQRALGYTAPEIHISNFQGVVSKTNILKHYPPDPVSCIFWLKNRMPQEWRDKQTHEHSLNKETMELLGIIDGGTKGQLPDAEEEEDAG